MSEIIAESTQKLALDRQEIVDRCRTDLNFLAPLAMPTVVTELFPPVFLAIWQLLIAKCSLQTIFRLLLGLPRGHAKTTFIKLFCLYLILYTDRQFVLCLCASQPKAENFLADIVDMLDEPNIVAVFGNWRTAIETDTLSLKKFVFMGRDIILAASGQGSVRGLNIKNRRPDVIVMDDVQDKENAESETESHNTLKWIQSTVMKLRDPKRCFFIYIGNKYKVPPNCVCVLEKLQQNDLWVHIVTGAILEDGEPLWPALHSKDSILEEFQNDLNMGVPEIFFAEIMNDTETTLSSLIDLTKIPLSPFDQAENAVLCQGKFVIIDVATNKIGADDTVVGLFSLYEERKCALEDMDFGSLSPLDTIKSALTFCFTTGANVIAVENSAYQSSLLFWFNHVCQELQIGSGIHFVEVQPMGKKNKRILAFFKQLLPAKSAPDTPVKEPDVYLGAKVREKVFNQALSFRPSKTTNDDNIIDMGSYWQQVLEKYEHLIALPHAMSNADYDTAKVEEFSSSF